MNWWRSNLFDEADDATVYQLMTENTNINSNFSYPKVNEIKINRRYSRCCCFLFSFSAKILWMTIFPLEQQKNKNAKSRFKILVIPVVDFQESHDWDSRVKISHKMLNNRDLLYVINLDRYHWKSQKMLWKKHIKWRNRKDFVRSSYKLLRYKKRKSC